jgi:ActR/RegA family two-component response regulator
MTTAFVGERDENRESDWTARSSGLSFRPLRLRPKVLVVEDNGALARALRWAVLAKCEATVLGTARQAEECLPLDWDAFIFDVALPDGCGLATMRKALEAHPDSAALIISGLGRYQDVDIAASMGAYYLGKPFTPGQILKFLDECLPRTLPSGDEARSTGRTVPDPGHPLAAKVGRRSACLPSPFPREIADIVAAARESSVQAVAAESEHAYQLALLARSVSAGCATSIDACAKAAGVSRQMLQDFATLTARWEPEKIAEMLSMADRCGRPITRAVLLRVARGSIALRRDFDDRVAKGELDLGTLAAAREHEQGSFPRG